MPAPRLQRMLHAAFALFFLFPVGGFLFFSLRYSILGDEYLPYFFLGLLVFSWLGFSILKSLFQRITTISKSMSTSPLRGAAAQQAPDPAVDAPDELNAIVESFQSIRSQFGQTMRQLEKKSADISLLKELSELCYVTSDPEEILYIHSLLGDGERMATTEFKINFIKPVPALDIIAEALILHRGRHTAVGDVTVTDTASTLVAKALTTYAITRTPRTPGNRATKRHEKES